MLEKRGRTVRSENGDLRRCQFRGDRLAACDGKVAKGGLRKFSGPSAWLEKPSPERPDAGTPVRPPVAARPCIPRARLLLFAPIPLALLITGRQSHPEQHPSVRNPSKTAVLQCRRARNMRRARVRITGMGPQGQVGRHPSPTMSHPLVGNANALRDIGPVSRSPRWPNLARHFPAGRALVSD